MLSWHYAIAVLARFQKRRYALWEVSCTSFRCHLNLNSTSINNLHIYKVIVELEQSIPMRAMKAVIVEERFNKRGNIVYKSLDFNEISEV